MQYISSHPSSTFLPHKQTVVEFPTPPTIYYITQNDRSFYLTEELAHKWHSLKDEMYFSAFELLIERIREPELRKIVPVSDVIEVIQAVADSPSIRQLVFEASQDAAGDCHERPLNVFNTILALARFGKLEAAGAAPHELLELAKGITKQSLLDEATLLVMTYQWKDNRRCSNGDSRGPDLSEAITCQTDLRRALGEELNLPFLVPIDGQHCSKRLSKLTAMDREVAKNYVTQAMTNGERMVQALMSQPVWKQYMERRCAQEKEGIDQEFRQRMEQLEKEHVNNSTKETIYMAGMNDLVRARQQKIDLLLHSATRSLCTQTKKGLELFQTEKEKFCIFF